MAILIGETIHPDVVIGADIVSNTSEVIVYNYNTPIGFRSFSHFGPRRYYKNELGKAGELCCDCSNSKEPVDAVLFSVKLARYTTLSDIVLNA